MHMAEQGNLMGTFTILKSDKAPLRLYNTYRGLPFSHTADILRVEQDMIATRVHRHQAVSMAIEGQTHLRNSTLPEVIRANVVEVDYRKKQAVLSEFTGVGNTVGKRITVRVQPGDSIEAEVSDGRRWIRGRIANISTNGMCIFTFSESMHPLSFGLDRDIYVDFTLPGLDTVVRFLGVITNIREQAGSYLYRVGLRIFPNPEIQPLLEDYISRQQQAILREIELEYHSMCRENIRQG
jgi:hypothetical protein